MASRKELLRITYHDDDDTGMYEIGEIDFGICSDLDGYLERYGRDGKADIVNTLSFLICEVERRFRDNPSTRPATPTTLNNSTKNNPY